MDIVTSLLELQELDKEILQLHDSQKRIPQRITQYLNKITQEKSVLSKAEEDMKSHKLAIREHEGSLASLETNIQKKQLQLHQIKTNREYTALLQEIEQNKQEKGKLEENILRMMDETEVKNQQYERQTKAVADAEEDYKRHKAEADKTLQEIEQRLQSLSKRHEEKRIEVEKIDKEILKIYQRLSNSKTHVALLSVEDETCGFCHIKLRANQVAALASGRIVFCPDCDRMLYQKRR